jgi:hypothetical protein
LCEVVIARRETRSHDRIDDLALIILERSGRRDRTRDAGRGISVYVRSVWVSCPPGTVVLNFSLLLP